MIKGYGVITSETHLYEVIDKDQKQEHESHFVIHDDLDAAVTSLENNADLIVSALEKEFGDTFDEHVSVQYNYVGIDGRSEMKSYDIHVTSSSSVNIYKGEIVAL